MSKLIVFATVSAGVFIFVVISLANTSYAANPSVSPRGNQIGQELRENRCVRISSFIDTRIDRYNENKQRHTQNHVRILEKITNLISSLDSKGIDTTKLERDFDVLKAMTETFATKYNFFIGKLTEAKTLGCGESEGAFKEKMVQARTALKEARDQAQEIWKYINTVIRANLNDLRTEANQLTDNN